MLIAASRCYLIQMLRSALTCTNGCSCWSADEENSPQSFPYHGCALPTELGGKLPFLQLNADILSLDAVKGPTHRTLLSLHRRDDTGSLPHRAASRSRRRLR